MNTLRLWSLSIVMMLANIAHANESDVSSNTLTEQQRQEANQQAVQEGYTVGAGDILKIEVFGEPDMSMRVIIDNKGQINFPYINQVSVLGKTLEQIENYIENNLRGDYLINPNVTVTMDRFRKFYVTGQVEDPDGYEYQPGLTVEKALATAGGFTDRADRDEVNIRRSGSQELLEDVSMTELVYPGDTVIVEMSFF